MATSHYNLNELGSGGSLADNGYKFGVADRVTIDEKLYLGAEGHHHTGVTVTVPSAGPSLTYSVGTGTLLANTRYYYKISWVDSTGRESPPSAESSILTPAAIVAPGAPTLSQLGTGGTLTGGNYTYVLSAYEGTDNRQETKAITAGFITVAVGTTNKVTLTFPSLPSGAAGFNIYRRTPGGTITEYLTSVAMNVATPPTTYVDDGSVAGDCDRTTPLTNRTSSNVAITITVPGATPTVASGYTWKIYRTTTTGVYTNSFLHQVVEYVNEATPTVIKPSYIDLGNNTTSGSPSELGTGSPEKVLLTNGAEVQGLLPQANIAGFPYEVMFAFSGTLVPQSGQFVWQCPFATATIQSVQATMGENGAPAAQEVIVDVRKGTGAVSPTFSTIFTDSSRRPTVEVGHQYSAAKVPNITSLVQGDMLLCDVLQTGGGATPTDKNMTVTVLISAKFA